MNTIKKQEYNSFVFTHIPKCGGSSFRKMIYEAAVESGIADTDIYIPGEGDLAHDKNMAQLNESEFESLKNKKRKVIADHSNYLSKRVNSITHDSPFRITFLRRPINRFISHYNFFCFQQGHGNCKDIPLSELKEEKFVQLVTEMANVQTAFLRNINPGEETLSISKSNQNITFKILENEFDHFGVLEELSMSMDLLKEFSPEWLKFKNEFPLVNKTKVSPESNINPELIHKFNSINILDIRLYRFALNLLKLRHRFYCK